MLTDDTLPNDSAKPLNPDAARKFRGRDALLAVNQIPAEVARDALYLIANGMAVDEAFEQAAQDHGLFGEIAAGQEYGAHFKFPRIVEDY